MVVGNGSMLSYKVYNKNYWSEVPGNLYIDVPNHVLDSQITVIAVLLDGRSNCIGERDRLLKVINEKIDYEKTIDR